ncbi:Protein-glutamine gamma-glutamyltransferase E [Platysternon megacephalum]|uniref:Protein-glutamine gamma-glutamyltransferase E n=1 Tax=Platysternon megacephalum TaxID=55544 RepID=A0A4D9E9J7_9SAUR|nr:Protein-glutamine gamma-glutamyltransferase E [Platysternon megacephalum]
METGQTLGAVNSFPFWPPLGGLAPTHPSKGWVLCQPPCLLVCLGQPHQLALFRAGLTCPLRLPLACTSSPGADASKSHPAQEAGARPSPSGVSVSTLPRLLPVIQAPAPYGLALHADESLTTAATRNPTEKGIRSLTAALLLPMSLQLRPNGLGLCSSQGIMRYAPLLPIWVPVPSWPTGVRDRERLFPGKGERDNSRAQPARHTLTHGTHRHLLHLALASRTGTEKSALRIPQQGGEQQELGLPESPPLRDVPWTWLGSGCQRIGPEDTPFTDRPVAQPGLLASALSPAPHHRPPSKPDGSGGWGKRGKP